MKTTVCGIVFLFLSCHAAQQYRDYGAFVRDRRPIRVEESRTLQCQRGITDILSILACSFSALQFYYAYTENNAEQNHLDIQTITENLPTNSFLHPYAA
jgi:hypothetical protein